MQGEPQLIIIAEDDRDDSLFLLTALFSLPRELTIIAVPNGEELINILEVVSPHIIFLDINMPKKNGFEALQFIRSKDKSDQPTVIMCSTSMCDREISMSRELGADLFITKPTSLKLLNKMIEDIFKRDWAGKAKGRIPESMLLSHVQ
jgi:DNA-binding response OmpR family regulator